ncbi:MAG: tripartite tricarboxylate transporter TctB family protein [Lawsonibacter sp.]
MKKGNLITAAICAVLGILVIAVASGYPNAEAYGTGVPGPGLWPICISAVLLACSAMLVFRTLRMPPEEDTALNLWSRGSRRVYITMLILLIYIIVLPVAGFLISTAVMQFVFLQWFAKKKPYITVLISVAVTMLVYCVFKFLLNVPIDFGMFAL